MGKASRVALASWESILRTGAAEVTAQAGTSKELSTGMELWKLHVHPPSFDLGF